MLDCVCVASYKQRLLYVTQELLWWYRQFTAVHYWRNNYQGKA